MESSWFIVVSTLVAACRVGEVEIASVELSVRLWGLVDVVSTWFVEVPRTDGDLSALVALFRIFEVEMSCIELSVAL